MSVTVITPPSPIVSINEMERHLADLPEEDREYVETLIAAATGWIDGPSGWLGRSLGVQLLEHRDDAPRSPIVCLPYGPVLEVEAAWVGDDPVDVSGYSPDSQAFSFGMTMTAGVPIRIRYWTGYGRRDPNDPEKWINDVPAPIRVAIMMLVAQWYNTRENVITGTISTEIPFAVEALLQPFKVYR